MPAAYWSLARVPAATSSSHHLRRSPSQRSDQQRFAAAALAAALASAGIGISALAWAFGTFDRSPPSLPPQMRRLYELGRLIGVGNSGNRVFEALDVRRGCLVAIKVARTTAREIEALEAVRALGHANLVGFMEHFFDSSGRCFIVMELMEGGELFAAIRRRRGALYSDEAARRIFAGLFSAVRALHGAGVCHRDIKPENVCLVHREDGGVGDGDEGEGEGEDWEGEDIVAPTSTCTAVKLCDFGNSIVGVGGSSSSRVGSARSPSPAKAKRSSRAAARTKLRGTRGYMAPAMLRAEGVDVDYSFEVDYFSLGVVLYVMLTGYSSEFTGYRSQLRWSSWVEAHMKRCGRQGDNSAARALVDMLMDSESLRLWFCKGSNSGSYGSGGGGGGGGIAGLSSAARGAGDGPIECGVELRSDRLRPAGGVAVAARRDEQGDEMTWATQLREGDAVDARWLTRRWRGKVVQMVSEGGTTVAVVRFDDVVAPLDARDVRLTLEELIANSDDAAATSSEWAADASLGRVAVVAADRHRLTPSRGAARDAGIVGCRVEATFAACASTWWRARVVGAADEDGVCYLDLKYASAWEQVECQSFYLGGTLGSEAAVAAVAADAAEAAAAAALPTRVRAAATRRSWSARKRAGGRWKLRWPFVALGVAALGASFAITAVSLLIAWREADTEEVAAEEEER